MDGQATKGLISFFQDIPDHRARNRQFRLIDLFAIAVMAVICDAQDWTDVATFARIRKEWLDTFMELPGRTPSSSTFRRMFRRLNPDAFEKAFEAWIGSFGVTLSGQHVCIDGKTLRQSFEHAWDKGSMAHMVSAFITADGKVVSQVQCSGKGKELEAIKHLLTLMDAHNAVVTIDALGCQEEIAAQITRAGGDYVLAVKDNQPSLHQAMERNIGEMILDGFKDVPHGKHVTTNGGHGRTEIRRLWVLNSFDWLPMRDQWPGLRSLVVAESQRKLSGSQTCSVERRCFISSIANPDAESMAQYVRGHWGIENNLHWQLDMTFREDESRIRTGHGAENFSRLRRMALNILKADPQKMSVKTKRKAAGWDPGYLVSLLGGWPATPTIESRSKEPGDG